MKDTSSEVRPTFEPNVDSDSGALDRLLERVQVVVHRSNAAIRRSEDRQKARETSPEVITENPVPHWKQICRRAAVEQDPKKLLELVKQLNRLVVQRMDGLKRGA